MNENHTSESKTIWCCIGLSILIHIGVLLAMFTPFVISFFTPTERVVKPKKEPAKKEYITVKYSPPSAPKAKPAPLVPKVPVPSLPKATKKDKVAAIPTPVEPAPLVPAKPKEKPAPQIPQVARTTDNQPQGLPTEKTNLQGERDTIASSNAPPTASSTNNPSVKGKKSDHQETVDTTYQDGLLEHMNSGGNTKVTPPKPPNPNEVALDPKKIADKNINEKKSSVEKTSEIGDSLLKEDMATTDLESPKKFIDSENKQIADAQENLPEKKSDKKKDGGMEKKDTIANNKVDPDALKQKAIEEKRKADKIKSQQQTAKNNSKKGFRSQAKATVMEGSISRRSNIASRNVKATPLGKYMATVSKLIEKEWQRRCMMNADLISPGTLRLSVLISANGKVSIRTLNQINGSASNLSITHQAVRSARIPPMPSKVRSNQNGDPIEFRYSFQF